MSDFKEQLKAIRPKITHRKAGDECGEAALGQLPYLGRVKSWNSDRGFGLIDTPVQRWPVFFHISGSIKQDSSPSEPSPKQPVLFMLGTSPKRADRERQAVQWCLVDDIEWAKSPAPATQEVLDSLRWDLLCTQSVDVLLGSLEAEWYRESWKGGDTPRDLNDEILRKILPQKLKGLGVKELEDLSLQKRFSVSPYTFVNHWLFGNSHFQCWSFVSAFSGEQLSALGAPQIGWLPEASTNAERALLVEWVVRSSVCKDDETFPARWLRGTEPWEGQVAEKLLSTGWKPTGEMARWLQTLVQSRKVSPKAIDEFISRYPDDLVQWFNFLSEEEQGAYLSGRKGDDSTLLAVISEHQNADWLRNAVCYLALAVDLETDGEVIREVGTADFFEARINYEEGKGQDMGLALEGLARKIADADILVGHNITAWDWPILRSRLPESREPILWDTMLVQFMLEPWAASHSLGSSHRADEDAQASFELFSKQLQQLPEELSLSLLKREIGSTRALLETLGAMLSNVRWQPPTGPRWMELVQQVGINNRLLVVPDHVIAELGWVCSVAVVTANSKESLSDHYLEVGVERLVSALSGDEVSDPLGLVLQCVLWKADSLQIRVRLHMLPLWLRSSALLSSAIARVMCVPQLTDPTVLQVAPLPRDVEWYLRAAPEDYLFLYPPGRKLGSSVACLARSSLPDAIQKGLEKAHETGVSPRDGLWHCDASDQGIRHWAWQDAAAHRLSHIRGDWLQTRSVNLEGKSFQALLHSMPESKQRPKLLRTGQSELFPGSQDQASYWQQVLSTFLGGVEAEEQGVVPILIVMSSRSQELVRLLQEGLAEVGRGEVALPHHGRNERLLRAFSRRYCLVDVVDNWMSWKILSQNAGIFLQPVVESLPIQEWCAVTLESPQGAAQPEPNDPEPTVDADTDSEDLEQGLVEDDVEVAVGRLEPETSTLADVLVRGPEVQRQIPTLLREQLREWLWISELDGDERPVLIIEPRLDARRRLIEESFETIRTEKYRFSEEQETRLNQVFEPLEIYREEAPDDYDSMQRFLIAHWNRDRTPEHENYIANFRPGTQQPAMVAIADRAHDVLVSLPTGEGKSVLFQVPALCRGLRNRRLTLVISPLKALMRDQVNNLASIGFGESVDYLSGDRSIQEAEDVYQGLLDHRIVLLYVAPERLRNRRFADALRRRRDTDGGLEYIVVDEAHCVNQWGYAFRPDYFYALRMLIREFRAGVDRDTAPLLLLSATVTASDRSRLEELAKTANGEESRPLLPFVVRPEAFHAPLRSHISVITRRTGGSLFRRADLQVALHSRLEIITDVIRQARANRERTGQQSAVIVFVSRREHAEQFSRAVEIAKSASSDYFHAGLDAQTREEVYERFREGEIDVLFATKAFGMGMDIPHIHWAVHVSPPSFLEDYLQEVGRIGRGKEEMRKADLAQLHAVLLYSDDDFEAIREQRARNEVGFRQIADWFDQIRGQSRAVSDAEAVVIVPDAGFKPPNMPSVRRSEATRLRIALYWLERCERAEILHMLPGLIAIELRFQRLVEIMQTQTGPVADVARVLLSLKGDTSASLENRQDVPAAARVQQTASVPSGTQPSRGTGSWVKSVLQGLAEMVGFLFGEATHGESGLSPQRIGNSPIGSQVRSSSDLGEKDVKDAAVNLGEIWKQVSLSSTDEVLQCLADLDKQRAISIKRSISFVARPLHDDREDHLRVLFGAVEAAGQATLKRLGAKGVWALDVDGLAADIGQIAVPDADKKSYQKAFEKGLVYLLKASGVRLRQRVNEDGEVVRELRLSRSAAKAAFFKQRALIKLTTVLWKAVRQRVGAGENNISIAALIRAAQEGSQGGAYREFELRRAFGFLAALQLVSSTEPMVPMSYVLSVRAPEKELSNEDNRDVWAELEDVNRLAELRGLAMEMFVHLPDGARKDFIEGYFQQSTTQEMESFLDDQLGEIEDETDETGNKIYQSFISRKREELRATAVEEFFRRYKRDPEEPNQWKAITHSFNRHLLVNAGPGSGKTAVLLARVAHLIRIQQLRPAEIQVLSFNRAVVFEIRARLRQLFGKLGYAAYVRRVNVHTFHAFALRHVPHPEEEVTWAEHREKSIVQLADLLERDAAFRLQVAGGLRAILVDEFQDVNDDIYRILKALSSAPGPSRGLMVIGDDDQDILRWNRSGGESSDHYFLKFQEDFGTRDEDRLVLRVNFRSGREIVEHSQTVLTDCFRQNGSASTRMKQVGLIPSKEAEDSVVHADRRVGSMQVALDDAKRLVGKIAELPDQRSLAVLCRSNAEVANTYLALRPVWRGLSVQAVSKHRVASLRNLGLWLDVLREDLMRNGDRSLSTELEDELLEGYSRFDIPEVRRPRAEDFSPGDVLALVRQENHYPRVSHLVEFIEGQDVDELERLRGRFLGERSYAVVSSIHKVKGLEFDRVVIMPSASPFPFRETVGSGGEIGSDAAEEARLFYVGMTRARRYLRYYLGPREQAWMGCKKSAGEVGERKILQGAPDEVWIGWSWTSNQFNPNPEQCQDYIEREVSAGDVIKLGGSGAGSGKSLFHFGSNGGSRQIGFLARKVGTGGSDHDLIVSSVIRYPFDAEGRESLGAVASSVQTRGWGYLVLVAGILR